MQLIKYAIYSIKNKKYGFKKYDQKMPTLNSYQMNGAT